MSNVYTIRLDGLNEEVTPKTLRNFFSFATDNLSVQMLGSQRGELTVSAQVSVNSRAEVESMMEARVKMSETGIFMSQPTARYGSTLTPSASTSTSLLFDDTFPPISQPSPQSQQHQLPYSPPASTFASSSGLRANRAFQPSMSSGSIFGDEMEDLPKNVYVLNLPVDMSQREFEAIFSRFGTIEHACLLSMLDNYGRRRGFLLMATHGEAKVLIEKTHGKSLRDCRLEVSWAQVQKGSHAEITSGKSVPFSRLHPPPVDGISPSYWNPSQEPITQPRGYGYKPGYAQAQAQARYAPSIPMQENQPFAPGYSLTAARSLQGMPTTTLLADGLCAKAFPTIDHVVRTFLPRGNVIQAAFLPDQYGNFIDHTAGTRSASVTYETLKEAAYAVSWHHGRFYGGKQIQVRWEGEVYPKKPRRANPGLRIDSDGGYAALQAAGNPSFIYGGPGNLTLIPTGLPAPPSPPKAGRMQTLDHLDPRSSSGSLGQYKQGFPSHFGRHPVDDLLLAQEKKLSPFQSSRPMPAAPILARHSATTLLSAEAPPFEIRQPAFRSPPTDASSTRSRISSAGTSKSKSTPETLVTTMPPIQMPATPAPGNFKPFDDSLTPQRKRESEPVKPEEDVLGILAGLSCDDDDDDEEDINWQESEEAKSFGTIGEERKEKA